MDFSNAIKKYLTAHSISKMDVKAALIDMDGVLFDSMKNHTLAWKQLSDELGIEATRDEFYLYEGMTGVATINLIHQRQFGTTLSTEQAREIYKRKAELFRASGPVNQMPGALDMVSCLKNNNITRVLVTGSGQSDLLARLNTEFEGIFCDSLRITAADVKYGKPNPEPYLMGQQKAGVAAEQAIVIENAPLGVKAGHASGCFTIGITTGPVPRQAMIEHGADLVFDSMPQFAEYLPALLNDFKNITI